MARAPKVSVVTRTRDREALFGRTMQGLAAQTFKDFEWIVVNDGGPKDYLKPAHLKTISAEHGVRVIHHKESLGRGGALKAGLDAAKGEFCLINDDDDVLVPSALEDLTQRMDEIPGNIGCVAGHEVWLETANGAVLSETKLPSEPPSLQEICYENQIVTPVTLFKKTAYDAAGGVDPSLTVLEDWDLWIRMLLEGDFTPLPTVVAKVYQRKEDENSAQRNSDLAEHRDQAIYIRNKILREDIAAGRMGISTLMNVPHRETLENLGSMTTQLRKLKRTVMFWRNT